MLKLSQVRQQFYRSLATVLVVSLAILAVGSLQSSQLKKLKNTSALGSPAELNKQVELEKVNLKALQKLPTFGFNNLVADWTLLNFLQYFGDEEARQVTGYGISPEYFEVIIPHDPKFLDAYYFLSTSSSIYAAQPERSVKLMSQGLKSLSPKIAPRAYYIWRQKGIDELLFLGNAKAAKQSFETAANWASVYPNQESQQVAAASRKTANFIARNPNSKQAQAQAWLMVLTNAPDDRTRKIAISRIRGLGGNVFLTPEGSVDVRMPKED
ncbi:hypothetical protein Cri9333_3405 [Crinalium epipsammum PCC 9333]|uniref:Uncharacterized protein n=1 Tax=Crinalium epipsammum PCC 9333 TaxID=1173022 RepID=K9W1I2_9CYAN|nr:hypothetical protein [Crinalium epipsammum]AFZ14233.1 hypothetical protein Cri9333_3405 [Crinalium epipsammum PCC 9333]